METRRNPLFPHAVRAKLALPFQFGPRSQNRNLSLPSVLSCDEIVIKSVFLEQPVGDGDGVGGDALHVAVLLLAEPEDAARRGHDQDDDEDDDEDDHARGEAGVVPADRRDLLAGEVAVVVVADRRLGYVGGHLSVCYISPDGLTERRTSFPSTFEKWRERRDNFCVPFFFFSESIVGVFRTPCGSFFFFFCLKLQTCHFFVGRCTCQFLFRPIHLSFFLFISVK